MSCLHVQAECENTLLFSVSMRPIFTSIAVAESSSRECQKANWPTHKKTCGKAKPINAALTSVQPFIKAWDEIMERPDFGRYDRVPPLPYEFYEDRDKFLNCRPLAFRRQAIYLNHSPNVDYVFFDRDDKPVEVVISDEWVKIGFRVTRMHILSGHSQSRTVLPALAEHLICCASNLPGLDTSLILEQLRQEYDMDPSAVSLTLELREAMGKRGVQHSQLEQLWKAQKLLMPYTSRNTASCEYCATSPSPLHLADGDQESLDQGHRNIAPAYCHIFVAGNILESPGSRIGYLGASWMRCSDFSVRMNIIHLYHIRVNAKLPFIAR